MGASLTADTVTLTVAAAEVCASPGARELSVTLKVNDVVLIQLGPG